MSKGEAELTARILRGASMAVDVRRHFCHGYAVIYTGDPDDARRVALGLAFRRLAIGPPPEPTDDMKHATFAWF